MTLEALLEVGQAAHEDPAEPGHPLELGRPAELAEVLVHLEEGLLDDVRRIGLPAHLAVEARGREEAEVVPVRVEQIAERLLLSLAGEPDGAGDPRRGAGHREWALLSMA